MSGACKYPAAEVGPGCSNTHNLQLAQHANLHRGFNDRDCAARGSTCSQQGVEFDTDIPVEPACTRAAARDLLLLPVNVPNEPFRELKRARAAAGGGPPQGRA